MIGKVVGGLAALGLIGGAGSVIYDKSGTATVKVKDKAGVVHETTLDNTGAQYQCPAGTREEVQPYVVAIGRIKITLEQVNQYTNPGRYQQLVAAENQKIAEYNAILDSECTVVD